MGRLGLTALLSHALVAFTIELDNEFEHLMPHRTASKRAVSRGDPWLVSLVMWSNCMRFVGDEGVTVRELERRAGTSTNLAGMQRWGYIVVGPDRVVRPTKAGRRAQGVWRPLTGEIERRWEVRFGEGEIDQLRRSLGALVEQLDGRLPDGLPILRYGLYSKVPQARVEPGSDLSLPSLLSRVLLAFALEFEAESTVSLAIGANVLRVLDETGVRVRDLPRLTGVSKESIAMALGVLEKRRLAAVEPDPAASRGKVVRLTPAGLAARASDVRLLDAIEQRWIGRFGQDTLDALRASLEQVASAPLAEPYPDGWRASRQRPGTLPHYPMVLHRGGYPDGA